MSSVTPEVTRFTSIEDVEAALQRERYLPDRGLATAI
ncbi:MAG: hypothetical protein JWQ48_2754, partial [Conexibacter sp.]|nr:hypothetical protein [Conexibacter sp.]